MTWCSHPFIYPPHQSVTSEHTHGRNFRSRWTFDDGSWGQPTGHHPACHRGKKANSGQPNERRWMEIWRSSSAIIWRSTHPNPFTHSLTHSPPAMQLNSRCWLMGDLYRPTRVGVTSLGFEGFNSDQEIKRCLSIDWPVTREPAVENEWVDMYMYSTCNSRGKERWVYSYVLETSSPSELRNHTYQSTDAYNTHIYVWR